MRLQTLLSGFKGFETVKLGGFTDYQFGSFKSRFDYGPSIRIQGNPTESSFGKIDLRYLVNSATLDTYGFLSTKRMYFDLLGNYNLQNHHLMLRPGIDVNVSDNSRAGLEAKIQGSSNNLHLNYVGIRATLIIKP